MLCEIVRINGKLKIREVLDKKDIWITLEEIKQYVEKLYAERNKRSINIWEQFNQLQYNPTFQALLREEAKQFKYNGKER